MYSNGGMQDLNDLIAPSSGWTLTYALGINDSGQIVRIGENSNSQEEAFLLKPVSEPSTFVVWTGLGTKGLIACV